MGYGGENLGKQWLKARRTTSLLSGDNEKFNRVVETLFLLLTKSISSRPYSSSFVLHNTVNSGWSWTPSPQSMRILFHKVGHFLGSHHPHLDRWGLFHRCYLVPLHWKGWKRTIDSVWSIVTEHLLWATHCARSLGFNLVEERDTYVNK